MSVLADASALLWWLQRREIEIGSQWRAVADHWETQTLAGARPFYLVHAMMAFAAAGRTTTVWRMLEALPHTSESSTLSVPENALVKRKTNESDCSRDRNLESIRRFVMKELASLLSP